MNAFAAARDGKGRKAFTVPTALSSDDAEWTALDKVSMARWLEAEGFRSPRLRWLVDYACRDDYGTTAEHVSAWAGIWYFAARQDGAGVIQLGAAMGLDFESAATIQVVFMQGLTP